MWLKTLFARTLKNVKSGFRKWLEDLPPTAAADEKGKKDRCTIYTHCVFFDGWAMVFL
jgi:hypothetical protein